MMADKRACEDRRVVDRRMGWLVSDWKKSYKWLSIQIPAAMTVLGTAYQAAEPFFPGLKEYVEPKTMLWILMLGIILAAFGRLKAQGAKP